MIFITTNIITILLRYNGIPISASFREPSHPYHVWQNRIKTQWFWDAAYISCSVFQYWLQTHLPWPIQRDPTRQKRKENNTMELRTVSSSHWRPSSFGFDCSMHSMHPCRSFILLPSLSSISFFLYLFLHRHFDSDFSMPRFFIFKDSFFEYLKFCYRVPKMEKKHDVGFIIYFFCLDWSLFYGGISPTQFFFFNDCKLVFSYAIFLYWTLLYFSRTALFHHPFCYASFRSLFVGNVFWYPSQLKSTGVPKVKNEGSCKKGATGSRGTTQRTIQCKAALFLLACVGVPSIYLVAKSFLDASILSQKKKIFSPSKEKGT